MIIHRAVSSPILSLSHPIIVVSSHTLTHAPSNMLLSTNIATRSWMSVTTRFWSRTTIVPMQMQMIPQLQQQQQQQQRAQPMPLMLTMMTRMSMEHMHTTIHYPLLLPSWLQQGIWFIKRTFQPSIVRRKRKGGFLVRQRTVGGRRTIRRRRAKGRWRLGI